MCTDDVLGGANYLVMAADCNDVLPTFPDACFDAIVTDPPYGTSGSEGKRCGIGNSGGAKFYHEWDTTLPLDWLSQAARVVRPGGSVVLFTDNAAVSRVWDAGMDVGLHPLNTLYWVKPDPPATPRQNFASAVETAVFFRTVGRPLYWGGGGWTRNVFEYPLAHKEVDGKTRYHPTQKPVRLMRDLVRLFAPPNGIVLDPFAGSGTTLVAAIAEGRRGVAIERLAQYAKRASDRCAAQAIGVSFQSSKDQLALFGDNK